MVFSKTRLKGLPTPEKGRVYYHDERVPGLTLCITPADTRTFYLYRWTNGRPVRIPLGRFPEVTVEQARTQVKVFVGAMADGHDPQAERRKKRQEPVLADLFTHWLEVHAKAHKKSWAEDERQYNAYLADWGNRRLSAIARSDVQALHARLGRKNGIYTANRVLALLRAMFNEAGRQGWLKENPALGVQRFKEKSRDRFLMPDELPRFFQALAEEPDPVLKGFFLMALLTGARRRNVEAMRWEDIDFGLARWRIPDTKTGEPHIVPLSSPAIQALIGLKQFERDGWVFPARRKSKTGHLMDPMPAWRRILARAGLENLRIHDLRRSLGSWQALTGSSLHIVGKTLGHTRPETTQIYARLQLDPIRDSVDKATTAMLMAAGKTGGLLEGPKTEGDDDGEE